VSPTRQGTGTGASARWPPREPSHLPRSPGLAARHRPGSGSASRPAALSPPMPRAAGEQPRELRQSRLGRGRSFPLPSPRSRVFPPQACRCLPEPCRSASPGQPCGTPQVRCPTCRKASTGSTWSTSTTRLSPRSRTAPISLSPTTTGAPHRRPSTSTAPRCRSARMWSRLTTCPTSRPGTWPITSSRTCTSRPSPLMRRPTRSARSPRSSRCSRGRSRRLTGTRSGARRWPRPGPWNGCSTTSGPGTGGRPTRCRLTGRRRACCAWTLRASARQARA
jgi:hypothetical protein